VVKNQGITDFFLYLYEVDEEHSMPENIPAWLLLLSFVNAVISFIFEYFIAPLLMKLNACFWKKMEKSEVKDD